MPPVASPSVSSAKSVPLTVFNTPPKVARLFPHRKSLLYALICLLWLVFGIFGRDPWKPEETLIVAAIADQLSTQPFGEIMQFNFTARPDLYLTLTTATAAATADWLVLHEGARLTNIILLVGGFLCLWLAAAKHYGARTAWITLLLLVGCFGFMIRAHVLNFGIAAFFGMALAVLGAATIADEQRRTRQVFIGGCIIGAAAVFMLLSCGLTATLIALTALVIVKKEQNAIFAVTAAFFLPALIWLVMQDNALFAPFSLHDFSPARIADAVGDTIRIAAWSLLPLLPLALYGLWYNRNKPLDRLLWFCLIAVVGGFVFFLIHGKNEEDYYLLLPPLALLTARLLLQTPEDTASAMDFFALLIIGVCVVGSLWLCWLVLALDIAAFAATLHNLFPGYVFPPYSAIKVLLAAVLTVGWIILILNFGRNNERAVVNLSCGITLIWALVNLLFIGYIDSGKSYRAPAKQLLSITGSDCVSFPDERHWRAQLAYFGVRLGDETCPYYLLSVKTKTPLAHLSRHDRSKDYYLYRRF